MKPLKIWRYILIVFVLTLGIVYSLPNLYSPDPAVQISYLNSNQKADLQLKEKLREVLDKELEYSSDLEIETNQKYALIRLSNSEKQLEVKELLSMNMGNDVVIALNLAPTTPQWLRDLNAEPMKLGLDLRGGVHFLLEVDTNTAIKNRLDGTLEDIKRRLREEKIRYKSLFVEENKSININLAKETTQDAVISFIKDNYPQFKISFSDKKPKNIFLVLSDESISQIQSDAIDQNLTTLRNRVNELGVSEPIVQRQGKTRIVVQLPGVQDTSEAKKILGKTATLEFHLEAELDTPRTRKTSYPHKDVRMGFSELQDTVIIGGDSVATAQASFDENGMPQVNITLDGQGGAKMHRATRGNIGKRLGVLFVEQRLKTSYKTDNQGNIKVIEETFETKEIISLATIRAALGSQFRITGLDSPSESSELALFLRAI